MFIADVKVLSFSNECLRTRQGHNVAKRSEVRKYKENKVGSHKNYSAIRCVSLHLTKHSSKRAHEPNNLVD